MAYVPPHKRLGASSTPEAMPSASSSSGELHNKLVVLAPPGSTLRFDRFIGGSYAHLRNFPLYTASIVKEDDLSSALEAELALSDHQSMASSIVEKVLPDFLAVVEQVRLRMGRKAAGDVHPKMLFKFGKVVFHYFNRGVPSDKKFSAHSLEESWRRVIKTFDTSISENAFNSLKEMALAGAEQTVDKIRYIIVIRHPEGIFRCSCSRAESGSGLQLRKIRDGPFRLMVTDVLCTSRKLDVRLLTMYTQTRYLSESVVHALVDAAVVDENVKAGVRWELGKDSCGPFKVAAAFQLKQTIVVENGRKWTFAAASREDLETGDVRLSLEAHIGLKGWKTFMASGDKNQDLNRQLLCKMVDVGVRGLSEGS